MLTQLESLTLHLFAVTLTELPCEYKLVFYKYNFVDYLVRMRRF